MRTITGNGLKPPEQVHPNRHNSTPSFYIDSKSKITAALSTDLHHQDQILIQRAPIYTPPIYTMTRSY